MTEEILRTGGCLCGKSRYQTRGDSPRAIMCHCRYCQTYTGSAFGTQVWFPEDKVTLISGELSKYDNNTETGNVVTLNFCKNCGSTIFLRLNVFQGMVAIPGGSFDPPTFWFVPQVENFCRTGPKHHLLKRRLLKSMIRIQCIIQKSQTTIQLNRLKKYFYSK